MKKQRLKEHPYLWTVAIIALIFIVLWVIKGIYPFGNNSLIWGDMHDQVTAFYYHFYDSFHGDSSLLVDFKTSGGINFLGIFAYYLSSPISFLILLFPREHIYQVISILIAVKVVLSGVSFLYFVKKYFKSAPNELAILASLLYAFSGYHILLYQITAWMDIAYLFPLLMIGLKKVLDLEKPTLYIIILTTCLIASFYLSGLMMFFLIFTSLLYLYFLKEKSTWKKAILNLGISTVLSILLSSFLLLPALEEYLVSSRAGFSFLNLINSKMGPLNDKLCFFITAGFSIVGTILLFLAKKKTNDQKWSNYLFANIILFLIPVFIEPVNKMWHLGSYAFFPLRLGFILLFFLLVSALYYFSNLMKKKEENRNTKKKIITTIIACSTLLITTICNFNYLQHKIYAISLGRNLQVVLTLLFMVLVTGGAIYLLFYFNQKCYSKKTMGFCYCIVLTNIMCASFLYYGINYAQDSLTGIYEDMQTMHESYQENDYKRVKDLYPKLVMNHGMVTKYHTLDHFTSLTDKSNMETLKKMGYSSYWVKTYSINGTLFSDALLANQYVISKDDYKNLYYEYQDTYGSIQFYQHKSKIPYGYFIKENATIMDLENAFAVQNQIYHSITGKEDIITLSKEEWTYHNLVKTEEEEGITQYEVIQKEKIAYLEKVISVKGRKNLYLEMLYSIENAKNKDILETTNIYINGKLLMAKYPREIENGLLDLGIFENEEVKIRIEFIESPHFSVLEIGELDLNQYESWLEESKNDLAIKFAYNEITASITSSENQLFFLPIAYNKGYEATVNGEKVKIEELFDNFIGLPLQEGQNEIKITFIPPGFRLGSLISAITLILTVLLLVTPLYEKLLNLTFLNTIVYSIYLTAYGILVLAIYLLPIIGFFLSFLFYIRI